MANLTLRVVTNTGDTTKNAPLTNAEVDQNFINLDTELGQKVVFGGALGTPSSGTLTNCSFPTLNQNTTGSAATLTTPRAIYGNNFNGSAELNQVIASNYGGTGNGFTKFSGATTSEKTYTLPDTNATILYSGGALGTPSSGTLTNCSFPTLNQNTSGNAATADKWSSARNLAGNSIDGSANVAFSNKFIVQGTADAGLSGAQFLGALTTGIVKNTTTSGVLSIASPGSDYLAPANIGVATGNVVQVNQTINATTREATTTLGTSLNHTLSNTSTTITAFNGVSGVTYHCRALGAGEITHHATNLIIAQTGASITTAVNDTFDVEMTSTTQCIIKNYQRASGSALISVSITDDGTTNTNQYLGMTRSTSGTWSTAYISSTELYFNPSTGTLNSPVFNSLSDYRVKKNVQTIDNALNKVQNLRGVDFNFISSDKKSSGVIAQELEYVLPHLIEENVETGLKSVNYNGLIGVLIESIKELNAKIAILESGK